MLLVILTRLPSFGQYNEQELKTDSSDIEIIRNSLYYIYKETYRNNDSVWYSVHFIKDTTRLNTEGWERKSGKRLGLWKEYNFNRQLLYTWDYDNGICNVNTDLYPYHDLLQRMKSKTDSLIITTYSKYFYDHHVSFEYECYAYHHYKTKFDCCEDSMWTDDYLGSWTEPIRAKPNSFLFRYQVRLHKTDEDGIELGICLDSLGNYVPGDDDFWNNYGFENVNSERKTFNIDINNARNTAKRLGLIVTDTRNRIFTTDNFDIILLT